MVQGIRLKASPNQQQKKILSQWMGCARYIWNAKCITEKEQWVELKNKEGEYPTINATYSQYKEKETTPWLFQCPSVILRNSVSNWRNTYRNFLKKQCGKPRKKRRNGQGSVYLTREIFSFQKGKDGVTRLLIGGQKHSIGVLSIKTHRKFKEPNSIYIKKNHDRYWVSFCYEDGQDEGNLFTEKQHLDYLSKQSAAYLGKHIVGIDRGIARPIQTSISQDAFFQLSNAEKASKKRVEKQRLRYQKKLSRQKKGSNRRYQTKKRLANRHQKVAHIRQNFCHQTTHAILKKEDAKVVILEDLGTKRMTKRPKAKKGKNGKWLKNNARAKAGLNRSILDQNWYMLENQLSYKAYKAGKAFFKVSAHHTSQECAHCRHIHPSNRKKQASFSCVSCGHTDNADFNAAKVIKNRAIELILDSGTELSKRGVLTLSDMGRGAIVRHD